MTDVTGQFEIIREVGARTILPGRAVMTEDPNWARLESAWATAR